MSQKISRPLEKQSLILQKTREERKKDVSSVVGRDTSSINTKQDSKQKHPYHLFLILLPSPHKRSYELRLDTSELRRLVLKTRINREMNRWYEASCWTYSKTYPSSDSMGFDCWGGSREYCGLCSKYTSSWRKIGKENDLWKRARKVNVKQGDGSNRSGGNFVVNTCF